jgi:type II secretory pathway pseudopilin PulG
LVVISIIVVLAAFTIPSMQPAMESRRIKLAARSVRGYLGVAQLLAVEKKRPVGVLLERDSNEPRACRVLRQVEVPPPYAGDFEDSVLDITSVDFNTISVQFRRVSSPNAWSGEDPINPAAGTPLIKVGDEVQVNHQGHRWMISDIQPDSTAPPVSPRWLWDVVSETTSSLPPAATVRYRIIRQPVPSAAAPLQLPRGMAIDLNDSGDTNEPPRPILPPAPPAAEDQADVFAALNNTLGNAASGIEPSPLMIMFSPGGGIHRIYRSAYDSTGTALPYMAPGTRPVFLMIGKWDRAGGLLPEDGLQNWQDAENLWLALNPKTGQMTVDVVSTYWDQDGDPNTPLVSYDDPATNRSRPPTLFDSRRYVREAQINRGGR